ncbi:MAG: hypothetical protein LBE39_16875 [Flavobacteriaceae bacterium]|jgi:hypothetical protein|nr:hypothetical protein [Flavobacteriaceae bacterium]
MIEKFLDKSIKEINYKLKNSNNLYLVDEAINVFDLKTIFFLIETVGEVVEDIKIVFEKGNHKILFDKLVDQYGFPSQYYDENSPVENQMKGNFINWNIKKMPLVSYEESEISWLNNNIWDMSNYVIKLLKFPIIRGIEGDYLYLHFHKK